MDWHEIESLHQQASDHYVRGEYREALEVWKRVLELDPEDEKAREGARLSGLLGESEVEEPLEPEPAVPDDLPPDEGLRLRLAEIDSRIESGDFHGALRCAESLESERPEDAEVLSALSRACLAAGDSDRAAEATGRLLSLTPEYAEAARLLEECRRVSPAESQLGVVELREQDAFPGSPDADFPEFESHSFLEPRAAQDLVPALSVEAPEEKALDPVTARAGAVKGASYPQRSDPAANALGQRVADLLHQAREAAAAGRNDDALGLLSRLLILDEENAEGLALEQELRQGPGANASGLEELVATGIRHFDNHELEQAREAFLEALESDPGHKQALEYLEKTDSKLAAGPPAPERMVDRRDPSTSKPRGSVWQAPSAEDTRAAEAEAAGEGSRAGAGEAPTEQAAENRARRRRGLRLPSVRLLAACGIGLLVLAGGFLGVRLLLSRRSAGEPPAVASAPTEKRPKAAKAPAAEPAPPPVTAEERAEGIGRTMARAAAALEAGDYEAAILGYNAVLALDPVNEEARKRLLEAGDLYHKSKVEIEKLDQARRIFSSGEYESALRLLYRLPEALLPPTELNRYKVNGWYDLGVVALRGADCGQAITRFGEALAIDGTDAGVRRGKQLADACRTQRKDRAYYDVVENLPFRKLDD